MVSLIGFVVAVMDFPTWLMEIMAASPRPVRYQSSIMPPGDWNHTQTPLSEKQTNKVCVCACGRRRGGGLNLLFCQKSQQCNELPALYMWLSDSSSANQYTRHNVTVTVHSSKVFCTTLPVWETDFYKVSVSSRVKWKYRCGYMRYKHTHSQFSQIQTFYSS